MTIRRLTSELPDELIESGFAHQVNLSSNGRRLVVEPTILGPADAIKDVLEHGGSVISAPFEQKVNASVRHELFPDKIVSEERSAHGVGFGRLIGRKANRRMGETLKVAMKPFGELNEAVNEVMGYWTLQALGVETFDPVGIFSKRLDDEHLVSIVMTQKRDSFMSLDRDDWVVGRRIHSEEESTIAERNTQTVKEIAETLAWLHGNGVFHPDGQVKNYAVTNTGKVGVIDTEHLTMRPLGHPDTASLAVEDVEKLLKSLILTDKHGKIYGVGMLAGMTNNDLRACYEELVLNPYTETLFDRYAQGQIEAQQAQTLIDGLQHHFEISAASNWPLCLVNSAQS